MIATTTAGPTVLVGPGRQRVRVRCLARRGMLHSETEAVDHLRLSPGAAFDLPGDAGAEAAWYVLRGPLTLGEGRPADRRALDRGELVLTPAGERVRLTAGPQGAELLFLSFVPREVSEQLPPRRPDLGVPS